MRFFAHICLTLTLSAIQSHAGTSQHTVIGVVPGDYDVTCSVGRVTSSPLGILRYNATGPCTVSLTLADGHGGPTSNGCSARPRVALCEPPWNEAWGFYHAEDDSMVGYVEFREGQYWTAGGASFGWRTDEVSRRRLCNVTDWAGARAELGAPVGLCLRTLRGEARCGP